MFPRICLIALVMIAGAAAAPPGRAYSILQQWAQPAAPNVEGSYIRIILCDGPGENGKQFYTYEYDRPAGQPTFRAVAPPNWGQSIGGHDFDTFQQAAQAACS
jgi:hypothetical protein